MAREWMTSDKGSWSVIPSFGHPFARFPPPLVVVFLFTLMNFHRLLRPNIIVDHFCRLLYFGSGGVSVAGWCVLLGRTCKIYTHAPRPPIRDNDDAGGIKSAKGQRHFPPPFARNRGQPLLLLKYSRSVAATAADGDGDIGGWFGHHKKTRLCQQHWPLLKLKAKTLQPGILLWVGG